MGFEDIFAKLEAEKAPLPDDRPKLAVRKVLYNKSLFSVKNSFYTLVEDAAPPPEESPAPAAPPPAPSQTTATRGNFLKDKLQAILGE